MPFHIGMYYGSLSVEFLIQFWETYHGGFRTLLSFFCSGGQGSVSIDLSGL